MTKMMHQLFASNSIAKKNFRIAVAVLLRCSIDIVIAMLFSPNIVIGIAIVFISIANNPGYLYHTG